MFISVLDSTSKFTESHSTDSKENLMQIVQYVLHIDFFPFL